MLAVKIQLTKNSSGDHGGLKQGQVHIIFVCAIILLALLLNLAATDIQIL